MSLGDINGVNGVEIVGAPGFHDTGSYLSSADIDGDGYDDMVIGATSDTDDGASFVVYGKTLSSFVEPSLIGAGQDDDLINAEDSAVNAGRGDDEVHVINRLFFLVDGGTGTDTLHFDYAGLIDVGNIDGFDYTSDRHRIQNIEVLDIENEHLNTLRLHLADVLNLDVTISDVGGVAGLDNVLRIDGNAGDLVQLFSADGWSAADTTSLAGYAIYSYQALKIAVDTDVAVSMI